MSVKTRTAVFVLNTSGFLTPDDSRRLAAIVKTAKACRRTIEVTLNNTEVIFSIVAPAPKALTQEVAP